MEPTPPLCFAAVSVGLWLRADSRAGPKRARSGRVAAAAAGDARLTVTVATAGPRGLALAATTAAGTAGSLPGDTREDREGGEES